MEDNNDIKAMQAFTKNVMSAVDNRIKKQIKSEKLYKHISGEVISVESDNSRAVISVGDDEKNQISMLNKTGEILSVGDSVWIEYFGSISNGCIRLRNGTAIPAGGSGGVGQFTNNEKTNEIFNAYPDGISPRIANEITNSSSYAGWNHVEGRDNKCVDCNEMHIEGSSNTVSNSSCCSVGGYGNTVSNYVSCMSINGSSHAITNTTYGKISGNQHYIDNCTLTDVSGSQNIVKNCQSSMLGGYTCEYYTNFLMAGGCSNVILSSAGYSLVGGGYNLVTSFESTVGGYGNTTGVIPYANNNGYTAYNQYAGYPAKNRDGTLPDGVGGVYDSDLPNNGSGDVALGVRNCTLNGGVTLGNNNIADNAVAVGHDNVSTDYSFACGAMCQANNCGFAGGSYCSAGAVYDIASSGNGYYNKYMSTKSQTSQGSKNFAFGNNSKAFNLCSVAMGNFLLSTTDYSTSFGTYNSPNDCLLEIGNGTSSARSNAFTVAKDGTISAQGSTTSNGADYAEYFEWLDENKNNEDRIGLFVTLDEDKIRLANSTDTYILGIISALPSVIGDNDMDAWKNKYLTDIFGRYLYEDVEVPIYTYEMQKTTLEDGTEKEELVKVDTGETKTETHKILNPDYDEALEYQTRKDRKEWAIVGMLGKLIMIDDGSCVVNGYCQSTDNGVATNSDSGYRVLKRIDETHIQVLFK